MRRKFAVSVEIELFASGPEEALQIVQKEVESLEKLGEWPTVNVRVTKFEDKKLETTLDYLIVHHDDGSSDAEPTGDELKEPDRAKTFGDAEA